MIVDEQMELRDGGGDIVSIERIAGIVFHEEGTLNSVTRWMSSHDEGIAEWLKNARRAYQPDRGSVEDQDRIAVILLKPF